MNSLKIDKKALEPARKQFCLDIGLPWEEYVSNPRQQVYIRKAVYREGTLLNRTEGARNYEGRNDFFHAIICLGQLFLIVDQQIYDWAVEKFADCSPEWFCEFGNLRMIDEKLKEFGHRVKDTHVYFLPKQRTEDRCSTQAAAGYEEQMLQPQAGDVRFAEESLQWYDREEILKFKENNRFTSAICFSQTQPDVLAVAALKEIGAAAEQGDTVAKNAEAGTAVENVSKIYDQSLMRGMAGASADGQYLWQIGINVIPGETGKGLANRLVRALKERILAEGKTPFYGTSESHTISQTVGLKAGFVPAWTEVYAECAENNTVE